jgi:hypothetical protein
MNVLSKSTALILAGNLVSPACLSSTGLRAQEFYSRPFLVLNRENFLPPAESGSMKAFMGAR